MWAEYVEQLSVSEIDLSHFRMWNTFSREVVKILFLKTIKTKMDKTQETTF